MTVRASRHEERLHDCVVSPHVFDPLVDRLRDFVVPYQRCLDVCFISSQPVMQRLACTAGADKRPVQMVWAVRCTRPAHDVVDDAFG
jgi:hypothetical protein